MHMFYRVMKGIYQFAAHLLSYIPAKYYWNRSTSDLVIAKSKRVNFFLKHSVYAVKLVFIIVVLKELNLLLLSTAQASELEQMHQSISAGRWPFFAWF